MVKAIWHKVASPPQIVGSIVFARWCQRAFPWGHIGATWWIRLNLCFLLPTKAHNPNGKSIGSAAVTQLMVGSPYTLQWAPLSPITALGMGWSGHLFNRITWVHPSPQPKRHLDRFCRFLHRWLQSVPKLYNGTPHSPLQKCPFPWGGIWTPI